MAAGLATLRLLARSDAWDRLEALGESLQRHLEGVLQGAPMPVSLARLGSIFWLSLQEGSPPRAVDDFDPQASGRYSALFRALLERGVYLAPSAYEVGFLSLAHDEQHLARFADALDGALAQAAEGI